MIVGSELDRLLAGEDRYLVPLPAAWHRCERCGHAVPLRDQCCTICLWELRVGPTAPAAPTLAEVEEAVRWPFDSPEAIAALVEIRWRRLWREGEYRDFWQYASYRFGLSHKRSQHLLSTAGEPGSA